jgi:hypothetical protein
MTWFGWLRKRGRRKYSGAIASYTC